ALGERAAPVTDRGWDGIDRRRLGVVDAGVRDRRGVVAAEIAPRDDAERDRVVRGPGAATLRALRQPELLLELQEVLLDRRLRDAELLGDLADRRRLGERLRVEQRPAQRDEHVAFAWRELHGPPFHVRHLTRW